MRHFCIISLAAFLVVFSACGVFLGPDPDNSPRGIFDSIWNDFDDTYALFDVKGINWKSVRNTYSAKISSGMSDRELFTVCSDMLKELKDAHVTLMSWFGHFNSGGRFDTTNMEPFSLEVVKDKYLNSDYALAGEGMFLYGTFESNPSIGYIYISGFASGDVTGATQDWAKAIDGILKALSNTEAIILDIRGNRGGLPGNVDIIASRFAAKEKDYAQACTKNGPGRNDFSSPVNFTVKPAGTRYTKPLIFITNAQTISGGEWFTLALLSQNHTIHTGSTTCGAFSLSLQRFLVNGWAYTVSVQKVTDMQGNCYEGGGISPKTGHCVNNNAENIALNIDDQLEYALSIVP